MKSALSSHGRRVFETLALWLGLAALMVQTVAPLCAGIMGGPSSGIASIVICTVHGFETVQIGADGKPLPAEPAKTASDCCVACQTVNGFSVPSPIPDAIPSRIDYVSERFVVPPVALTRFYSSYVTRGPPHLS